jgi:hypothetical protein
MSKTNTIQRDMIRKEVVDVVTELLSDPDVGLELNNSFERKLKKSVAQKAKGKVTPLSKIFTQYGV